MGLVAWDNLRKTSLKFLVIILVTDILKYVAKTNNMILKNSASEFLERFKPDKNRKHCLFVLESIHEIIKVGIGIE